MYRLDDSTSVFTPKIYLDLTVLFHTHSPPHIATITGIPTYEHPDVYTVVFHDSSITEYTDSNNILEALPELPNNPSCSLLPDWVKGAVNATLFLFDMSKPRHGKLQSDKDGNRTFCLGTTSNFTKGIKLHDLSANCQMLLDTGQLFTAMQNSVVCKKLEAKFSFDCVLRHVSTPGLISLVAPSSLKNHSKLEPNDKLVWDSAYDEEFDGLVSLPSWEIITEAQYKQLSKGLKLYLLWPLRLLNMMSTIVQNVRKTVLSF
jgi:hypothetical protein